jgi:prephenate dehydrogenase
MTVKITIIGLGQIGGSIGLALANHKDQVTTLGYDTSPEVTRKALKMGAVEKAGHSLFASVKGVDVVILALPLDQVYATLKSIAQDVREDGLVMDTTPVKQTVAAWAKELLPPGRHYVGLTPALNPLVLDETVTGIEAARPDLFQHGLMAVTAPHGTAGDAIKLAANFVALLGAQAYFADLAEVDGIMATAHTLPALAAAALAETVIGQPGWTDIRVLAGRPFVAATRPLELEESPGLAEAARQNRINTVRLLDEYIATLRSLRDEIDEVKENSLQDRLERSVRERTNWRRMRLVGDWRPDGIPDQNIPTLGDRLLQQIGLGRYLDQRSKKKKQE